MTQILFIMSETFQTELFIDNNFKSFDMPDYNLTPHFFLSEFCVSEAAFKLQVHNHPTKTMQENLAALCENVLEPLRLDLDSPVRILSGYRCPEVNRAVGGVKTSQHTEGKAADISCKSLASAIRFILSSTVYDQCIYYKSRNFIHVSYNYPFNRKQFLIYD